MDSQVAPPSGQASRRRDLRGVRGVRGRISGHHPPRQGRFEQRDWHGVQQDALERLELYPRIIAHGVAQIRGLLASSEKDKKLWAAMKSAYTKLIDRCQDIELAETFFNSVSRRIFTTIGVDPRIEFLFSDFDPPDGTCEPPLLSTYSASGPLAEHIRQVLTACEFAAPFEDLDRDARPGRTGHRARTPRRGRRRANRYHRHDSGRLLSQPGRYLVGRINSGERVMPLTLALQHITGGIVVDAVLLSADEVSIIFSFTRSYFHVEVHRSRDVVMFLKSIMPRKPIAELYIAIGYNKHGKTELYRDLMRHIEPVHGRLRDRPRRPGNGDERLHASLIRRCLQSHPRPLRLPENLLAPGCDGALPARLQTRPRRASGGRPGVRASRLRS